MPFRANRIGIIINDRHSGLAYPHSVRVGLCGLCGCRRRTYDRDRGRDAQWILPSRMVTVIFVGFVALHILIYVDAIDPHDRT
jgi:hypothetical protein